MADLEVIERSIEQVKEWGWTIKPEHTENKEMMWCCPMGAVRIACDSKAYLHTATKIQLGVTESWVSGFLYGFDGVPFRGVPPHMFEKDEYGIGRQIGLQYRDRWLKGEL